MVMDTLGMDWDEAEVDGAGATWQTAEPHDPEVVERASAWLRGIEARQAEERAAEAERAATQAPPASPPQAAPAAAPQPVASVRGGYGHTPVTYQILEETMRTHLVTRKAFDTFREVLLEGVAKFVKEQVGAAAARVFWRTAEAERRIAELEARLAKLEGRSDDR
jgi:hypothetical protein